MKNKSYATAARILICLAAASLLLCSASCGKEKYNVPPDDITEGIHSEDVEITQAVYDYMKNLVDGMFSDMGTGISEKLNSAIKTDVESIYCDGAAARARMKAVMPEFDISEDYIDSAAQALGVDKNDDDQAQNIYFEAVSQYLDGDYDTVEINSELLLEKTDSGWIVTGEEPLYSDDAE